MFSTMNKVCLWGISKPACIRTVCISSTSPPFLLKHDVIISLETQNYILDRLAIVQLQIEDGESEDLGQHDPNWSERVSILY